MNSMNSFLIIFLILFSLPLVYSQISLATCQAPSQDRSFCLTCRQHYHLHQGLCYINILGCENYVFGNICRKCARGFILVNNQCCDHACMTKVYNQGQHQSKLEENKEETIRKAQVAGLQKSIANIAKNTVKTGQNYEILISKSQKFDKIFRYYVNIQINAQNYTAINDYNIVTGSSVFICMTTENDPPKDEITLTEDNIHGNAIYEQGYKFVYEKYGLELYEMQFARMGAINYGKISQLKFVFVGNKALLIGAMVSGQGDPYILYKQEKSNVEEIKSHIYNLKKIDSIFKQYNFQQIYKKLLSQKAYNSNDLKIIDITAITARKYSFVIYHKKLKARYSVNASYDLSTKKVTIIKFTEVFSSKLQDMHEPQSPTTKIISKQSLVKSIDAKSVFDYLYKIRPTFRQDLVESVRAEESKNFKKFYIMTKKDGQDYRIIVLQDKTSQQMQIINQGSFIASNSTITTITQNNDGTKTITTNNIVQSQSQVKTILQVLKNNSLTVSLDNIKSLQYTQGIKSTQYIVAINDNNGNPEKQLTILQNKVTNKASIIREISTKSQSKLISLIQQPSVTISPSNFYTPAIKDIIAKLQYNVQDNLTFSKINKIQVTNTTSAQKYDFTVQDIKGNQWKISTLKINDQNDLEIIKIKSYTAHSIEQSSKQQTNTVKLVTQYGIETEYTNNASFISSKQNVNIAISSIISQHADFAGYQVVSLQTKSYPQHQHQIIIMTNGNRTVQIFGYIDQKTLRYTVVQERDIPNDIIYPVITQNTIPGSIYHMAVRDKQSVKRSQTLLQAKYKMFQNVVPSIIIIQKFQTVDIVTLNYAFDQRKFIAVVQYNKTSPQSTKIIEVNPIKLVTPLKVKTITINGETTITSNNFLAIQDQNNKTKVVLQEITSNYPLLLANKITEITLTSNEYSDIFQVTYTNTTSKIDITVTVRTDKLGQNMTIDDIQSTSNTEINDAINAIKMSKVVLKQSDYSNPNVQSIMSLINSTRLSIENIIKIQAEIAPTYTTYQLNVNSGNKPYDITVIDYNNRQQIVAIRSTLDLQGTTKDQQFTTTNLVDTNGNKIIKSNDVTFIKQLPYLTNSIQYIKSIKPNLTQWMPKIITTIDYGIIQQFIITLIGRNPSDIIRSTVLFNKTSNITTIVSFQYIPSSTYTSVYITSPATIPKIVIPKLVKSDPIFSSVIAKIQKINANLTGVIPTIIQIQPLSNTITLYIAVVQLEVQKLQIIALYNTSTKSVAIISNSPIDPKIQPYYLTRTTTDYGLVTISNNISQITALQPQFPSVLSFSNQWLQTYSNWTSITRVQVQSTNLTGGSTLYTIQTQDISYIKIIDVSYNTDTKSMTVTNMKVKPIQIEYYPVTQPTLNIDITENPQQVDRYLQVIKRSSHTNLQQIKTVLSISKKTSRYFIKIYVQVLNNKNEKYFVTLQTNKDQETVIINVQNQQITEKYQLQETQTKSIDNYGNVATQITGQTLLKQNTAVRISTQTIITNNQQLNKYDVVAAKTVDYGSINQVTLLFYCKKTQDTLQSTTIYNLTSNQAQIVSVDTIDKTELTESSIPIISSTYPTIIIPSIAIPDIMKSNQTIQTIIAQLQSIPLYANLLPTTTQVQCISPTIAKYTFVMPTYVPTQIVGLYSSSSKSLQILSTTTITSTVIATYTQQTLTSTGQIMFSSNNLTTLSQKFVDFKYVIDKFNTIILNNTITDVNVLMQDSINCYKITTIQGINRVVIDINYDVLSNRTYLTNYMVETLPVIKPITTQYNLEMLSVNEKLAYIDIIKQSGYAQVNSTINVLQTVSNIYPLYKEIIMQVETANAQNYYVKFIQQKNFTSTQIVSVSPSYNKQAQQSHAFQSSVQTRSYFGNYLSGQLVIKTDKNGNKIVQSTNISKISSNPAANATLVSIKNSFPQYSSLTVHYFQVTSYGDVDQVVLTFTTPQSLGIQIKSISFYNKDTNISKVISVETVDYLSDLNTFSTSVYPSVVISDAGVTQILASDSGFKSVLNNIQSFGAQYQAAIPITTQIQTITSNITKYNVIIEVSNRRQQQIFIYDSNIKQSTHYVTTVISDSIKTIQIIQECRMIDSQPVIISNSIDQLLAQYPQINGAINTLQNELPNISIQSAIIAAESNSATITLITQNNYQQYIVNKYVSTANISTKINKDIIKIKDLATPKPIVYQLIASSIISTIPPLQTQIIKLINNDPSQPLNISKIHSVSVSKNTNIIIYHIRATDLNNKTIHIQANYNPFSARVSIVDVSELKPSDTNWTQTVVKDVSGVNKITTTSTSAIKSSKFYKQIIDFIKKNNPDSNISMYVPSIEISDQYQRIFIRTILFKQGKNFVQGSYVLDQRTQNIIQLSYTNISTLQTNPAQIIKTPNTIIYTPLDIPQIVRTNKVIVSTLVSISIVDSSLTNSTPIYIEINSYVNFSIITIVYDAETSNTRILTIYNQATAQAKVIDYSKISKNIQESKTIQRINQLGQKVFFTNNSTSNIAKTRQFTSVLRVIKELVPSFINQTLRSIQTILKDTGYEYTIITIEKGVINQVILQINNITNATTLISYIQTSVGGEIMTLATKQQSKVSKLDILTLQTNNITNLITQVTKYNPQIFDISTSVVSGTMKEFGYAYIYQIIVKSKDLMRTTIKLTRDKISSKLIINNVKKSKKYIPLQIKTIKKINKQGNFEQITNDISQIKGSIYLQTVIKNIYLSKPELSILKAISSKTLIYEDIIQCVIIFSQENKQIVQVTSLFNKITQNVTIIDFKVLPFDHNARLLQVTQIKNNIQVIPLIAIPTAITRNPQIKQIITLIQSSSKTKNINFNFFIIQNFKMFKKYNIITSISSRKYQNIYLFRKNTKSLQLIQILPVKDISELTMFQTSTNSFGENVTTSTSIDQIVGVIPEVSSTLLAIQNKYSFSITPIVKSITVKGTKTKQIKIVTQVSNTTQQTIYTTIVNGSTVQIIDIQIASVSIQPILRLSDKAEIQGLQITSSMKKVIQDTVYSNPIMRKDYLGGQILQIKGQSNSFISQYQITIVNSAGVTANIKIVQQQGQSMKVINIQTLSKDRSDVRTINSPAFISSQVSPINGVKLTITNDSKTIKSDITVKYVAQTIIAQLPHLIGYTPNQVTTTKYGHITQISIIFTSEGDTSVLVTTLLDITTHKVTIINYQFSKSNERILVQIIPSPVIPVAAKKFPEIQTMITTIKQSSPVPITIQSIGVKQFNQIKIYTPIVAYPSSKQNNTQYLFLYNKTTKILNHLDNATISTSILKQRYQKFTNNFGQTVLTTNNISLIAVNRPDLPMVLTKIVQEYNLTISSQIIQSLQISDQEYTTQYQIVVKINNQSTQITAIKENNTIKIMGLDCIQHKSQQFLIKNQKFQQDRQKRQIVDVSGATANLLNNTIFKANIASLSNVSITSITSTDNYLTSLYTIQTKDNQNNQQIVTISIAPNQQPQIVGVENIKAFNPTTITQPSSTIYQISQTTGEIIIQSTQQNDVRNKGLMFTPTIVKVIPNITIYQLISFKSTQLGHITWNTLIYKYQNQSAQVTLIFNATNSSIKVIDYKFYILAFITENVFPDIKTYCIPNIAILKTAQQMPQINQIVIDVQNHYKNAQIITIQVQEYGRIKKITTVIHNIEDRLLIIYQFNKTTNRVNLIQTMSLLTQINSFVYKELINKYGETTTLTNNVTKLTLKIPLTQIAIGYISNKYPITNNKSVSAVKVIEYPNQYQIIYVSQIQLNNPSTFVVKINKVSKQINQISIYSSSDMINSIEQIKTTAESSSSTEVVQKNSTTVKNIISYIKSVQQFSVNSLTVLSANKQTTLIGTQIITIEAITDRNTKIKTTVNYNQTNGQVNVNSFHILSQPLPVQNITTQQTIDPITGIKETITNDPNTSAYLNIIKDIKQNINYINSNLLTSAITSVAHSQYLKTTKFVLILVDSVSKQSTRIVSIFNKSTSNINVIDIKPITNTSLNLTIQRQIFSPSKLVSAQLSYPSIAKTRLYIQKKYPIYVNKNFTTVLVQPLQQVDILTYIYQTDTAKNLIVAIYNKTTGIASLLENNPIQLNVTPYFYKENREKGGSIIVTNNFSELVRRIRTVQILQTYLIKNRSISIEQIQTVKAVIGSPFQDFTLIIKINQETRQYQFIVNVNTTEVKQIDNQTISSNLSINNLVKPDVLALSPTSIEAKDIADILIDDPKVTLKNINQIVSISKQTASNASTYSIQYINNQHQTKKLIVFQNSTDSPIVIDERSIIPNFVAKPAEVVKANVDETTQTLTTNYPSQIAFKIDENNNEINSYLSKVVPEYSNYSIQSVRKQSLGKILQYDVLIKSDQKAPIQITLIKDNTNKNIIMLQNRKINEGLQNNVIQSSAISPELVEVSNIQKQNIKVLSKLSLVKDIGQYTEVQPQQINTNAQFMQAFQSVKNTYSTILNNAVIVKILQKKSLERDSIKIFYKAKDQIYEASIEMNIVTGESKLTQFIKIGAQLYPKSQVNVYSDLCYGYKDIQDFSLDFNLDFISNYLKQKYDSLKQSILIEAQQIILQNGQINYKIFLRKDSNTFKYIVYYQPEYKRIIEIKSTNFVIGDNFISIPKDKQVGDPYFRKIDTYVRQNSDILKSASVMHAQNSLDGQNLQYRTVYNINGKTYRSLASINKQNQNIFQNTLSQVIQIPIEQQQSVDVSQCNIKITKLDIHDLTKNAYFTQCYKYIQSRYQNSLRGSQLLGASQQSNFNTYTYVYYFIMNEAETITITVDFNPLTQAINVSSEPVKISLQDGYYNIKTDKRLTAVRNWLKENNPNLSNSVLVSSMAKKFYFGTLYKIVFKMATKYIVYIVYVDCGSSQMKIYDTQQLESYIFTLQQDIKDPLLNITSSTLFSSDKVNQQKGINLNGIEIIDASNDGIKPMLQPKLKGFARPTSSSSEN